MVRERIKACILGETLFRVGDVVTLAHGWEGYREKIDISDVLNLKIDHLFYEKENKNSVPVFKAIIRTRKGNRVEIAVSDLENIRSHEENNRLLMELDLRSYTSCIYCKAYEDTNNQWTFYNYQ